MLCAYRLHGRFAESIRVSALRPGIAPRRRVSDHCVSKARVSYCEAPSIFYLIRVSPDMTGLRQSPKASVRGHRLDIRAFKVKRWVESKNGGSDCS